MPGAAFKPWLRLLAAAWSACALAAPAAHGQTLTPKQRIAVSDYVGFGYNEINLHLRTGGKACAPSWNGKLKPINPDVINQIGILDSAMLRVDKGQVVHRLGKEFLNVAIGDEIVWKNFVSTSTDRSGATMGAQGNGAYAEITIGDGVEGIDVNRLEAGLNVEREIILGRGLKGRVTGLRAGPDGRSVVLIEVTGSGRPPIPGAGPTSCAQPKCADSCKLLGTPADTPSPSTNLQDGRAQTSETFKAFTDPVNLKTLKDGTAVARARVAMTETINQNLSKASTVSGASVAILLAGYDVQTKLLKMREIRDRRILAANVIQLRADFAKWAPGKVDFWGSDHYVDLVQPVGESYLKPPLVDQSTIDEFKNDPAKKKRLVATAYTTYHMARFVDETSWSGPWTMLPYRISLPTDCAWNSTLAQLLGVSDEQTYEALMGGRYKMFSREALVNLRTGKVQLHTSLTDASYNVELFERSQESLAAFNLKMKAAGFVPELDPTTEGSLHWNLPIGPQSGAGLPSRTKENEDEVDAITGGGGDYGEQDCGKHVLNYQQIFYSMQAYQYAFKDYYNYDQKGFGWANWCQSPMGSGSLADCADDVDRALTAIGNFLSDDANDCTEPAFLNLRTEAKTIKSSLCGIAKIHQGQVGGAKPFGDVVQRHCQ